jgi:tetratricopeptide (TPR) repeat protein
MKLTSLLLIFLFTAGLSSFSQAVDGELQTDSLRTNAIGLIKEKQYESAILLLNGVLDVDSKAQDSLGMAKSLYLISRTYALSNDFEKAISYGERGSEIGRAIEDHEQEFKINNTLGWAYFMVGKDFEESLKLQERQLYLVEQSDNDEAKAATYNNYGYDATVAGNLHLNEAIRYMAFANDYYAGKDKSKGKWYTLMNLTWQYRLLGDYEKSGYYGKLAVIEAAAQNDRHAIIETSTNLGETLLVQKKVKEAMPYYREAQKWSEGKSDRDKYVFDVYYSRFLWESGNQNEAIATMKPAIEFLKNNEVFYEMLGRAYLAGFLFEKNLNDEALEQIDKIEYPRADYISFEVRFLAALIKSKILKEQGSEKLAEEYIAPFLANAEKIGANYLVRYDG